MQKQTNEKVVTDVHTLELAENGAALATLFQASQAAFENEGDTEALDKLVEISELLINRRAVTLDDVRGKIRIWRTLAPEDALCPESASVDERLMLSILEDIEHL